jgi:hypothetical protein
MRVVGSGDMRGIVRKGTLGLNHDHRVEGVEPRPLRRCVFLRLSAGPVDLSHGSRRRLSALGGSSGFSACRYELVCLALEGSGSARCAKSRAVCCLQISSLLVRVRARDRGPKPVADVGTGTLQQCLAQTPLVHHSRISALAARHSESILVYMSVLFFSIPRTGMSGLAPVSSAFVVVEYSFCGKKDHVLSRALHSPFVKVFERTMPSFGRTPFSGWARSSNQLSTGSSAVSCHASLCPCHISSRTIQCFWVVALERHGDGSGSVSCVTCGRGVGADFLRR